MKTLIISPHADDEVLDCFSMLNKNSLVFYCGIDESKIKKTIKDQKHRISEDARKKEIIAVAQFLGFDYRINQAPVNYYELNAMVKVIEAIINEYKPEVILIPNQFTYNQDHQTIYKACKVALRPHDKNFFVKKVLVYESPCGIFDNQPLVPNCFIPIDINKKIIAYKLQKSQVRKMRSPEFLKALAKLRGTASNCKYAEGFFIEKWIE